MPSVHRPRIPVKPSLPKLATDPSLIDTVRQHIRQVGVVGEHNNAMLTYLIAVSRVLERPGAMQFYGPSGSGKSTVTEKISLLFPPEVKITSMSNSEASWFNEQDSGFYRHKVVICGERKHRHDDKAKDEGAILRQMLSEQRITRRVSVPGDTPGKWVTKTQTFDGPIAYMETTTSKVIFSEDLNRMLRLYSDVSEDHRKNVLLSIGSKYDQQVEKVDLASILKEHHEFQNYLQSVPLKRVVIPFHRGIASRMPAHVEAVARMTQSLFTVLEAIVVLHQFMRVGGKDTVVATIEDYRLARDLLIQPFRTLQGTHKKSNSLILWNQFGYESFTANEAGTALGTAYRTTTSRVLAALVDAGTVAKKEPGSGSKGSLYQFAREPTWDAESVLPTAEEVLCVTL